MQALIKGSNIKNFDKRHECLSFAFLNNQRFNDRIECLEIVKVLYATDPKLITNANSKYVAEAIQKNQL